VLLDVPWWRVARKGGTFAPQVARRFAWRGDSG